MSISRYNPRYVRSLVYMLQASEYNIADYLAWYHRTDDFAYIEKRRELVKTPKAVMLLISAWGIVLFLCAAAIYILFLPIAWYKYILAILILLAAPHILAYGLVIVVLITKALEAPFKYLIIAQAKKRIRAHKGIKIAIAGSFGKTSMREILKTILQESKRVASPPHSYNTPLGISNFIKTLKGDEEVLLFEFGEYYPGDIRKLCELVRPSLGIITGVNEAHLEKFKSLDKTRDTIFELSDWLHQNPLYINAENKLARENAAASHVLYSREGAGGWKVESFFTDLTGTSFVLVKGGEKFAFKSQLLGLHQIGPLATGIDIANRLGVPLPQIQKGVLNTRAFDHRLESKSDASGVITLDDSYNGNPDGVRAVIEFLASLKNHRRFYVTPGLVEMGSQSGIVHREIGIALAKSGIEKVILIKNSVTHYIEQGLKESNYSGEILWFPDAIAAFAALPHLTVKGDIVLLQNDWPDQYQ